MGRRRFSGERQYLAWGVGSALALALLCAPAASAWAPAAGAPIHPGVRLTTAGTECTSNFAFSGPGGVYLGQAAHCAKAGSESSGSGCMRQSLPLGTPITIQGASRPGTLVYSSWRTMQAVGERDPAVCQYNDFALARIDSADVGLVNPSVPKWGGPTGVGGLGAVNARVYAFVNSSTRLGLLSPDKGAVTAVESSGWSYAVKLDVPGIPGDSGSGLLNAQGQAGGVMSQLRVLPDPGSNGAGGLPFELNYLRALGGIGAVNLIPGTEPFNPGS